MPAVSFTTTTSSCTTSTPVGGVWIWNWSWSPRRCPPESRLETMNQDSIGHLVSDPVDSDLLGRCVLVCGDGCHDAFLNVGAISVDRARRGGRPAARRQWPTMAEGL